MSGQGIGANKNAFVRDLLRDFCIVCAALTEQYQRFAASGSISHAVLRDLLGRDMRKGVFWRLKDTAHHLFRTPYRDTADVSDMEGGVSLWQFSSGKAPDGMVRQGSAEALLDWCIGFAFHECVKLKEDAFQRQHYAHRLEQMRGKMCGCEDILDNLAPLLGQTRESIVREMVRIQDVLTQIRGLLIFYVPEHSNNRYLARFLLARNALVRQVFAEAYPALLAALYSDEPRRLYLLAAQGWLEGGRPREALDVLDALDAQAPLPEAYGAEAAKLRILAETFDPARLVPGCPR